jgi:hypothetical protein
MDAHWLTDDDGAHCDACLMRPALGLITLHDEEGHHVASWWTCGPCADHDAPIHHARSLVVAVVITEACL